MEMQQTGKKQSWGTRTSTAVVIPTVVVAVRTDIYKSEAEERPETSPHLVTELSCPDNSVREEQSFQQTGLGQLDTCTE